MFIVGQKRISPSTREYPTGDNTPDNFGSALRSHEMHPTKDRNSDRNKKTNTGSDGKQRISDSKQNFVERSRTIQNISRLSESSLPSFPFPFTLLSHKFQQRDNGNQKI
jgi:hypothetical protein